MKGLKTDEIVHWRDFQWGFFEVDEIDSDIGIMVYGFLAKYQLITEEEVAEPKTHIFMDYPIENKVVAKSKFYINLDTNIIAYHPVNGITGNQFCNNFSKIFEQAHGALVDAEIQSIDEPFKFLEGIKKFEKISKIQIYLHPSNPSNRDVWRDVDLWLQQINAGSLSEEIRAKPESEGLKNVEDDPDIHSKIVMSEDGYGETKITGWLDDKMTTISTKSNPVAASAPNDRDASTEDILGYLIETFRKIINRLTQ